MLLKVVFFTLFFSDSLPDESNSYSNDASHTGINYDDQTASVSSQEYASQASIDHNEDDNDNESGDSEGKTK